MSKNREFEEIKVSASKPFDKYFFAGIIQATNQRPLRFSAVGKAIPRMLNVVNALRKKLDNYEVNDIRLGEIVKNVKEDGKDKEIKISHLEVDLVPK